MEPPLDGIDWGIRTWILRLACYPAIALMTYPMSRMSTRSLTTLWRYGSDKPIRWRKRTAMNVDAEIQKWHQALVGLFLAHTKEEMDQWDYRLDDLMSVILAAPVAQLRELARGLREAMRADPRVPYFLWAPLDGLGDRIIGASDEKVIRLKVEMAERIARLAEVDVQPHLHDAIVNALKWRDEEVLAKVEIALKEGKRARLTGRESCLFLEVGEEPDVVRVML